MAEVIDGEFTAFVNERGDALLRVAYALAGNQHAAEDLLQNALAKAYARWPRIRGDAEPYVKRILYHDQVSGWRRRARRAEVPVAELPERPAAGDGGHDADLRLLLRDALRALPLDRARGRYLTAEGYDGVFPAPVGSLSAVTDEDRPREVGLVDLADGTTRWYEVGRALSPPEWSPDGRRLLFTTHRLDHFGFIVLETDGTKRAFRVDEKRYFCTDYCDFTWSRDGTEAVLPQTGRSSHDESLRDLRAGVRLFSADDGRPTRFVPVPGDPAGPWAWSPDGKLVVVQGQHDPLLVETGTGRVVRTLPTAEVVWISDDRLLYRRPNGAGDVVLADLTGRELVRQPLPKDLVDREITVAPR